MATAVTAAGRVVDDAVDAKHAVVFDVLRALALRGQDVEAAVEIADPEPAGRVEGQRGDVAVGQPACVRADDATQAAGPIVHRVQRVLRQRVQRAVGLHEALDRSGRVVQDRPRAAGRSGAERNLRERRVERADEQSVAPDGHGPGEQAGTERADVMAAFELGDAERRADVRAVAVGGNRKDTRIGQPAALVKAIHAAGPPVPDALAEGPDPHVGIRSGERRHGDVGQLRVCRCQPAAVEREQPRRAGAEQQPSGGEREQGGQLPLFRPIGPHVKHATTIKGQQTVRCGRDQQLGFRRGREHADGEADEPRGRELQAGPKAPHDRAVRVVFDDPVRPGDEQMAVEQRGVAKGGLRADRLDVSRQGPIERADGHGEVGCRFGAVARLTDRVARFPGQICRDRKNRDDRERGEPPMPHEPERRHEHLLRHRRHDCSRSGLVTGSSAEDSAAKLPASASRFRFPLPRRQPHPFVGPAGELLCSC